MPDITFTLSSENIARLVEAYCFLHEYKEEIDVAGVLTPNPESKANFTKRRIKEEMVSRVKGYEYDKAKKTLPEPDEIDIA